MNRCSCRQTTLKKCFNAPIENALGLLGSELEAKLGENRGIAHLTLTPWTGSFVLASKGLRQVSLKLDKNCHRESADTHTHTHTLSHLLLTRRSDWRICSLLCYSNVTENSVEWWQSHRL